MPQSCRHPSTLLFPVPCCLLPVFILCRTSNLPQSQPAPPKTAPFQQLASLPFPGEGALSIVHNQLSSPPAHRPATLPTVHCCRACQQKLSRPESYSGEIRRRRKNTLWPWFAPSPPPLRAKLASARRGKRLPNPPCTPRIQCGGPQPPQTR